MQVTAAGDGDAVTGPQETRMAEDQFGRQQTFAENRLRAVEVGEDAFQQTGALDQAGFDGRELRPRR